MRLIEEPRRACGAGPELSSAWRERCEGGKDAPDWWRRAQKWFVPPSRWRCERSVATGICKPRRAAHGSPAKLSSPTVTLMCSRLSAVLQRLLGIINAWSAEQEPCVLRRDIHVMAHG